MTDEFVWTFPVYILAAGYEPEPDGGFSFDEDTWYISSDFRGVPHLSVFTDADLAERYRGVCEAAKEATAFPLFAGPDAAPFGSHRHQLPPACR